MLLRTYTPVWHKYRPVILRMMIDAEKEPQQYQLSAHEFRALAARQKSGFAFSLQVSDGKVVHGLKDSVIAQDLWEILQVSPKANELISQGTFEFSMDKQFKLQINKLNNQQ